MSWTCVTFDRLSLSLWFYFGYSGSLIFFFRLKWANPRQSWIVDSTPWIPDSRYSIPAFVSGSWILIPIVRGIQGSLGCIPDSKALDSRFYGFRNPDSLLTWGDILSNVPQCRTNYVSLRSWDHALSILSLYVSLLSPRPLLKKTPTRRLCVP